MLLRAGGTPKELIDKFLLKNFNVKLEKPDEQSKRRSPGTRYRHYAPIIPVKICYFKDNNFIDLKDNSEWGFIGLHEPNKIFKKVLIFNSLESYARELFKSFREFEAEGLQGIIAELPDDETGVGLGLRDRILRASAL